MRKFAARDFEDILQVRCVVQYCFAFFQCDVDYQCIIPVVEGLLPAPHNNIILDVFFEFAMWHAYAKLRLHTDTTLSFFENSTRTLGATLRHFRRTTCETYVTVEIPSEEAAHGRRKAALAAKRKGPAPTGKEKVPTGKETGKEKAPGPKLRQLNLATYKYHALGDYGATIRQYGPTDNYNTQVVRSVFFFNFFTVLNNSQG